MKKIILTAAALVFTIGAYAQSVTTTSVAETAASNAPKAIHSKSKSTSATGKQAAEKADDALKLNANEASKKVKAGLRVTAQPVKTDEITKQEASKKVKAGLSVTAQPVKSQTKATKEAAAGTAEQKKKAWTATEKTKEQSAKTSTAATIK